MAVKLRLMRMGKTKQPTYRVVAADGRSPRDGRFIEIVGFYEPRKEPSGVEIDNEKAIAWLKKGAQPTERVQKLLETSGAWAEFKGAKGAPPRRRHPTRERGPGRHGSRDRPSRSHGPGRAHARRRRSRARWRGGRR